MGVETAVLIFAFGAMAFWGVGDFLIQRSVRKIGDVESLAFIGLIGALGLTPFILKDFKLLLSTSNLILLVTLGIITFIVSLFDFEALRLAKLSTTDIIIELELPATIILAYVFFGEGLTPLQFVVISLIFVGILLIATESFSHWKIKWEKGALLALIAAIGMGLSNFLTSGASRKVSPLMAIWVPWVMIGVFCLVYIYKREGFGKLGKNLLKFRWLILWTAIFDTGAWIFYSLAVSGESVGIVTAITESYPAIAIILGVWLNKEKIGWHQYLGAGLAMAASVALATII